MQPSNTLPVLPRKGIFLSWQRECLGLAVTVAWFGFCAFFQVFVILPFCSEGQTLTCCMLSEVEIHDLNLWFLIQSILDLMCFETSAGLVYCAIG